MAMNMQATALTANMPAFTSEKYPTPSLHAAPSPARIHTRYNIEIFVYFDIVQLAGSVISNRSGPEGPLAPLPRNSTA